MQHCCIVPQLTAIACLCIFGKSMCTNSGINNVQMIMLIFLVTMLVKVICKVSKTIIDQVMNHHGTISMLMRIQDVNGNAFVVKNDT